MSEGYLSDLNDRHTTNRRFFLKASLFSAAELIFLTCRPIHAICPQCAVFLLRLLVRGAMRSVARKSVTNAPKPIGRRSFAKGNKSPRKQENKHRPSISVASIKKNNRGTHFGEIYRVSKFVYDLVREHKPAALWVEQASNSFTIHGQNSTDKHYSSRLIIVFTDLITTTKYRYHYGQLSIKPKGVVKIHLEAPANISGRLFKVEGEMENIREVKFAGHQQIVLVNKQEVSFT